VSTGKIVQVTLWNSPYLGNFLANQLTLAERVRGRFALDSHFVLGYGAQGRYWLEELDAAGVTWSIMPEARSGWRTHLDEVLREQSAVLAHTHFTAADLQTAAAAAAARIPCVWHIRTGFNGYPLRQRLKDLYKMRIVARRRVAQLVAVSPWLGELAIRRGAPRGRVRVVQNAVRAERFAQLPDRRQARERFGLAMDEDVVLALGWWPDVKGVDVFVDALEQIAPRRPSLAALLVGEEQMGSFLDRRLAVRPAWLRLSGFVSDPAWLYSAADIFVSASRHEGQSGAIGEALASALPVVMSEIPGCAAWRPAPAAITFPSEDAQALAARLEQLLDQPPDERRAAGERNREWARQNFSVDVWCEQLCEVYRELL
jgi:glycosyltransferase involved in cell wall biosynthesis